MNALGPQAFVGINISDAAQYALIEQQRLDSRAAAANPLYKFRFTHPKRIGADIKEMAGLDQKSAEAFISRLRDLCEAVRAFPAPVIARMPGWCLGGGLEVAAACDFRIAAHDAKFGMPEVRVGIPSVIHAALLPRLVGWGRARWLVMTAENIDAPTALSWGLVDVVAPQGGLDAAVEHTVKALLECGPEALRSQKALLRQWEELPLTESVNLSVGVFGRSFLTDEPKRLMQAFVDRKR
jgi:enoyl-CoA hydratase/carnithine racemase